MMLEVYVFVLSLFLIYKGKVDEVVLVYFLVSDYEMECKIV